MYFVVRNVLTNLQMNMNQLKVLDGPIDILLTAGSVLSVFLVSMFVCSVCSLLFSLHRQRFLLKKKKSNFTTYNILIFF